MTARSPNSIDQHVGTRMRLRRSLIEMSQSELGQKLVSPSSKFRSMSAEPTVSAPAACLPSLASWA